MITRCVVYCRVSTDAQERDGTSLDTQERACREYAADEGWTVVEMVRDTASGFSLERPGLDRVREYARTGKVDVVLAFALDRLSRKQTHVAILAEEMDDRAVRLNFVTEKFEDTATGQLLRSVKAFAAELEREKILERTSRGKAERARSGRLPQATGKGMYGYQYRPETGKREIEEDQAVVVRRIFAAFAGGASIIGVANQLNSETIPTAQGKQWSPATIFHMLRNEAYAGRTIYRRLKATRVRDPQSGRKQRRITERPQDEWIEVPDATPALVTSEAFAAVQLRLDDPERLRQGRRIASYALAGHLKCRKCGASMVGQTLQGSYRYYRCRRAFAGLKTDRCASRYVRANDLEEALLSEVAELLARPERVLSEVTRTSEVDVEENANADRMASIERQRVRLLKLYQFGEIDDPYLQRELRALDANRSRLTARESRPTPTMPASEGDVQALCERVRQWVVERGPSELPLICEALQLTISADTEGADASGSVPFTHHWTNIGITTWT